MKLASNAATPSDATTTTIVIGSVGVTANRKPARNRVNANASTNPTTIPAPARTTPCRTTIAATLDGRRGVYIKNTSTEVLYWGFSNTSAEVCAPLAAESLAGKGDGGDIWIDVGVHQPIFIKAASGSSNTAAIGELK